MGGCSGTGLGDELGTLFWNNEVGGVFLNWKLTWKLCPETRLVVLHCHSMYIPTFFRELELSWGHCSGIGLDTELGGLFGNWTGS